MIEGPLYATNYCLAEIAVRRGDRIVDAGSGLGQFSRALARVAGAGAVVGVEGDARQLVEARRQANEAGEADLVEFREGDAYSLPLRPGEWGTFDVAHARFVLEHVREPVRIVQQMAGAVKMGGRVVLADDDHELLRFWPELPGGVAVWRAYMRTYAILGNDADVGRKLVSLLHRAGLQPRKNSWIFFGSCQGNPDFQDYVSNFVNVVRGARESILAHRLMSDGMIDDAMKQMQEWSNLPDAALWYGMSWAEGVRR
jgi:SAM-dependent methyltransferase